MKKCVFLFFLCFVCFKPVVCHACVKVMKGDVKERLGYDDEEEGGVSKTPAGSIRLSPGTHTLHTPPPPASLRQTWHGVSHCLNV